MRLSGPVPLTHMLLAEFVHQGDTVVDATCGNGADTVFLAGLVGPSGTVWAVDIQEDALKRTKSRVDSECPHVTVELVCAGHENLERLVGNPVKAAVFNLGYLPGGSRACTTRPETTLPALEQASAMIQAGGVLAVTVYPGHDGGAEEAAAAESWASGLRQSEFHVWRMSQLNTSASAPWTIFIQKAVKA